RDDAGTRPRELRRRDHGRDRPGVLRARSLRPDLSRNGCAHRPLFKSSTASWARGRAIRRGRLARRHVLARVRPRRLLRVAWPARTARADATKLRSAWGTTASRATAFLVTPRRRSQWSRHAGTPKRPRR